MTVLNQIYPIENFFDQQRDELIAAFFSEDFSSFTKIYSQIYSQIYNQVKNSDQFNENDHKAINQIQLFLSKFQKTDTSYKINTINKKLKKLLSQQVRKETKNIKHRSFNEWKTRIGIDENQCNLIFQTAIVLQITSGCSNYCRRCNEWALPGVRTHFSFNSIKYFSEKIFHTGNDEFIYYCASDPLDWQDNKYNLTDIVKFLKVKKYTPAYGLLTKLPRGKANVLEKLIQENSDFSISVTNKNRKRIKSIEIKTGKILQKQHDLDDLLIPAGLDEDFSTVKSSITDSYGSEITPDGAFIIIPSFTSALNLTGQHRIPITEKTDFFITRKTGRKALPVEYFKPFEAINLKGTKFKLKKLLDAQIENIILDNADENTNPPGMMNIDEFLKTFEAEAVLRKKKLLPTIIKKYKKKFLSSENYKDSNKTRKKLYKENLKNYLGSCNKEKMKNFKKFAFSYFLTAISEYLKNNPARHKIIIYLKKNDKKILKKKYPDIFKSKKISSFFDKSNPDPFTFFQILVFRLLESPDDIFIHEFINKHPAVYDEFSDMFIPKV